MVTLDGQPVSAGRSLLRSAVMFVGWELAHVSMFVPRNLATDDPAAWQYVGLIAALGLTAIARDQVTVLGSVETDERATSIRPGCDRRGTSTRNRQTTAARV